MTTAVAAPVTWDQEVQAFAEANGVAEALPKVMEATRAIFSTAREVCIEVQDDPEIPDDRHLVIQVMLDGTSPQQAAEQRFAWGKALYDHCPYEHVCIFRLSVDFAP